MQRPLMMMMMKALCDYNLEIRMLRGYSRFDSLLTWIYMEIDLPSYCLLNYVTQNRLSKTFFLVALHLIFSIISSAGCSDPKGCRDHELIKPLLDAKRNSCRVIKLLVPTAMMDGDRLLRHMVTGVVSACKLHVILYTKL